MSAKYEKTASIRIEDNGEIIFRDFKGTEFEINVKRTQIVKVMGEMSTVDFIADMLNRSMNDALVLSNLYPEYRKTPEQKAVIAAAKKDEAEMREAGAIPRMFASEADRKMHEKTFRRHTR
jgi:hypothetical protein